jgi:hypothetical protein
METKKFTQFGTFTVIIMSILLIVFAVLLLTHGFLPDQETYLNVFLVLTAVACLIIFYKMTITIDNESISFKLGIGLLGKSYKISDIESCSSVKNSFIYGWGIHKIPKGWLYNVSGLKAIELRFKDSTRVVRIGTDNPDEIAGVITDLIGAESESGNDTPEYKIQSQTKLAIIILIIVAVFIFGSNYYDSLPTKINMKETQFEINGAYGFSINYSDISAIDTISQMPHIETRTNGFALGKVCKGYFRLTDIGSASLFINFGVSPFVRLVLKNGRVIFFNIKDRQSTIETFEKIKSKSKLN